MNQKENPGNLENLKKLLLWYRLKRVNEFVARCDEQQAWEKIQQRIHRRRQMRIHAYYGGMAASILIALCVGFALLHSGDGSRSLFANRGEQKARLVTDNGTYYDLLPGDERIYDAEGKQVAENTRKELRYDTRSAQGSKNGKHILNVPRGGEYKIVLSDGTYVHTNAESRLTYPVVFTGDKREIYLAGEAYFDVAKDSLRPFIVHTPCGTVEVVGTQFNVNTYEKDQTTVTLKQGSVKVYTDPRRADFQALVPGQQAIIRPQAIQTLNVQVEEFTSWAEGIYEYSNTSLETIVKQLSRWYDVNITFKNKQLRERKFAGVIFRNQSLQQAVDILSKVSNVKFVQKGNCIEISEKRLE